MRHVFRPDCLLDQPALEGRTQRAIPMVLQERVQLLDIVNPGPWPAMRQLGQIRQCGGSEIYQMLALEIPACALARDRRDALRAWALRWMLEEPAPCRADDGIHDVATR